MNEQNIRMRILAAGLILSAIILLAGCSDGGSPSAPAPVIPALSGVAASGAPMVSAAATLTCGDGTAKTATTDANGAYTFVLTNCPAPFVVSVIGMVGGAQVTLVSVQATAPAANASITVNTTPLTNALAATLASSGDPLDLVNKFATEKGGLTEAAVKVRKDALVAALADTFTAAGLDPTKFDIVTTQFSADRAGFDKLLDNIKVQVTPSGVTLTNVGGVKVDDMGDGATGGATADLSAGTISFSKSTDFTKVLPKLPAAVEDASIGDAIRDALNACFAQPVATRAGSTACQAVPVTNDYLNDGQNGTQEFEVRFRNSATYDNAKFDKPEVIRFYSSSAADTRALVKFTLVRADGAVEFFTTVVENSTATGGKKMMRGNQRPFKVLVNGIVEKRAQVATNGTSATRAKSTFFTTGFNLFVGFPEGDAGNKVSLVRITGPGLPAAGVFLNPRLAGCDKFFSIVGGATPAIAGAATPPNCTSLMRLSSRAVTAADSDDFSTAFGSTNPAFIGAKLTDAAILAIQPQSAYKFEIWRTTTALTAPPTHVFFERLRSRPYSMGSVAALDGEVDKVVWDVGNPDTVASIDPTSSTTFAGGATFTAKWTNTKDAAPVGKVQVQTRQVGGTTGATALFEDNVNVAFSANTVGLTNGGVAWPSTMKSTLPSGLNLVQFISRNSLDTQIFLTYIY